MKIKEITDYLESKFPAEAALDYDNPGLIAGDSDRTVTGCIISLDCTSKAIEEARKNGFNLIITHHPLIFGGIDTVTNDTSTGKLLLQLIKSDISCFASHTNLDLTEEFGNLAIAEAIGASDAVPVEGALCGVAFECNENVRSLSKRIASGLGASGIITINDPNNKVSKVFVQGGAFDEDSIPAIVAAGCDTVISGEIKHHVTVMLEELGINSIIAGHSATEQVYLPKLAKLLSDQFPQIKFIVNNNNESASVI